MRLFRPWYLMRCLYPEAVFRIKTSSKILFLTFDDGPDPDSTPAILRILEKYNIRAAFFLNGEKAKCNPDLLKQVKSQGHTIGNHSHTHPDGWRTSLKEYIEDITKADKYTSADLFRPPYGHLTPAQFRILKKKYGIVFWDLMPYDFDKNLDKEKILNQLLTKMRPGSIIVLHDSSESKVLEVLEDFLRYAGEEGYIFHQLTSIH